MFYEVGWSGKVPLSFFNAARNIPGHQVVTDRSRREGISGGWKSGRPAAMITEHGVAGGF
jgi:hypothetical protein